MTIKDRFWNIVNKYIEIDALKRENKNFDKQLRDIRILSENLLGITDRFKIDVNGSDEELLNSVRQALDNYLR